MSIYPDKDKQGNLTGKFRVEVQLQGNRARGRFDTLPEAQAAEKQWKLELVSTVKSDAPKPVGQRLKPMTLQDLYSAAKDSLWRGKAYEAQSIARVEKTIAILGPDKKLHTILTEDIDGLIKVLQLTVSDATVNRYLSALHSLLKWGQIRKHLAALPTFTWQEEDEGRIRWLTEDEETQMLRILESRGFPMVAKLIKVAISTGMRREELRGITKDNLEPNWVRLWQTKNGTARSVPIDQETHGHLKALVKGMPTINQLRYAWDMAKEKMGLANDPLFVFHACRHTCATRLVRDNINIRIIQKWMGHKRIETTLRYSHVNDTMLADALAQRSRKDVSTVSQSPATPEPVPAPALGSQV